MASYQTITRLDGSRTRARYVQHLRTFTGSGNLDLDLYETEAGEEILCLSPASDGRADPWEVSQEDANVMGARRA